MNKKIVHIITCLGMGGAQTMLYEVLRRSGLSPEEQCVISLRNSAYYAPLISELAIDVSVADVRSNPYKAMRLAEKKAAGADVVCCWMYHANLFGYYLAKRVKPRRLVWQIHHSNLDPKLTSRKTLFINNICARKSSNASLIVYAGQEARRIHEDAGYCKDNGLVLENGVDCDVFKPNYEMRANLRHEFGIPSDAAIVLSVGRNHPIKDLPNFISAFSIARKANPKAVGMMCGEGITSSCKEVVDLASGNGLIIEKDLFLLGRRNDIPRIMAGSDVFVLHSASEAFPNVLLQAMSSGLPCISTNVGDVQGILGSEKSIVNPGDSVSLGYVINDVLRKSFEERQAIGGQNRLRALSSYDINKVVANFERMVLGIDEQNESQDAEFN